MLTLSPKLVLTVPLNSPMSVCALDGRALAQVSHQTEPLHLILSGNHCECLQFFFIISSPLTSLVLGHPWLKKHNPRTDWSAIKIISWSSFCHSTCPQSTHPPVEVPSILLPSSPPTLTSVPSVYHDSGEVFSKALSLPPHHPYDCATKLLPFVTLPSSQL